MDKFRTENMASDDVEIYIRDNRSSRISEEDTGYISTRRDLREKILNERHRVSNMRSQKNAEHEAKYGDASDGKRSRLPQNRQPEGGHVPQG